jgi:hypothetical protein
LIEKEIKKRIGLLQDDPTYPPYPFLYLTCDRDPLPTESTYSGYTDLIYFWLNTVSNSLFVCVSCLTPGALAWQKIAADNNILGMIENEGWNINTASSLSSPGISFGTVRTPSPTNDTSVYVTIGLSSTILTAATVNINIAGSTIGQLSLSGLSATESDFANFRVPANSSYELVVTSGSPTLIYLKELSF